MRAKTQEQTDREISLALEQYDLCTEARYAAARRIRECPRCEGGYRIIEIIPERWDKPRPYATECDCLLDALRVYRDWLRAKATYEQLSGREAPEINRELLRWW